MRNLKFAHFCPAMAPTRWSRVKVIPRSSSLHSHYVCCSERSNALVALTPRVPALRESVADAMLAAQIGNRHAGFMLLQNPDDLLFRKAAASLHALALLWARTNFKLD